MSFLLFVSQACATMPIIFKQLSVATLFLLATTAVNLAAEPWRAIADHSNGVYAIGENVTWTVARPNAGDLGEGVELSNDPVRYEVLWGGGKAMAKGEWKADKAPWTLTAKRGNPGCLLLKVVAKDTQGKEIVGYGGAVFAPEEIQASESAPDDFDDFWQAKIAELAQVPMEPELELVDIGEPGIEYYKVTLRNIRGGRIHGQLAKPKGKSELPASLQVQWAGVYPLQREWVLQYARNGFLAMNIIAHDLPIDAPEAFYQEQQQGKLNDYAGQGNDDRETSYFLPMFLGCYRAVDYLTQREDWNGGCMIVHGGSQGGYQAVVTAGLHPAVTDLAANVPAGCDHAGEKAERAPGWPNWASRVWTGKDKQKMLQAARYFDAMHFAARTDARALVGLGLCDTVCPPEGILAMFNQLKGDKERLIMPIADHMGDHGAYYPKQYQFSQQAKTLQPVAN